MSTFDDDERSIAGNRPIDLFTITTPTITYRHTSHNVDVSYGGNTYTAVTMSRSDLQVLQDTSGRELLLYMPISHPLVQRFCASAIPERAIEVNVTRMQAVSGGVIQQWDGFATNIGISGHVAVIRVPSITDNAMRVRLPVVNAQHACNHVLYDSLCTINRAGFTVSTTVVSQTIGATLITLVIASIGGNPDNWARYGEVVHTATGQRVMVYEHTGTTFLLNVPIVGVLPGDAISVFAGCDHNAVACRDKFSNIVNFGGMPHMNTISLNPWASSGVGIITQY